jgi:hypothetical protein
MSRNYRPGGAGGGGGTTGGPGFGTTTLPPIGPVIITSASALVVNGPLTITAVSAGFVSTITILLPSRITQYSAAKAREQRANTRVQATKMRLNFITNSPSLCNYPDLVNPDSKLVSAFISLRLAGAFTPNQFGADRNSLVTTINIVRFMNNSREHVPLIEKAPKHNIEQKQR